MKRNVRKRIWVIIVISVVVTASCVWFLIFKRNLDEYKLTTEYNSLDWRAGRVTIYDYCSSLYCGTVEWLSETGQRDVLYNYRGPMLPTVGVNKSDELYIYNKEYDADYGAEGWRWILFVFKEPFDDSKTYYQSTDDQNLSFLDVLLKNINTVDHNELRCIEMPSSDGCENHASSGEADAWIERYKEIFHKIDVEVVFDIEKELFVMQ